MNYQPKRAALSMNFLKSIYGSFKKLKIWVKFLIIVILLAFIGQLGQWATGYKKPVSVKSNTPSDYLVKKVAYKKCKEKILAQIISPASAKFPDNFTYRIDAPNQIVHIQSYVDCQNVNGAMLRTNWFGKIGYNASSPDNYQSWAIETVIIK
jgi:hypothetical protein